MLEEGVAMERLNQQRPPGVVTARPAGRDEAVAQAQRPAPDHLLLGQRVRVHLRGGQELIGQLVGVSRYNLVVVTGQGRMVLFKHAVDWLMPEGTDKTTRSAG